MGRGWGGGAEVDLLYDPRLFSPKPLPGQVHAGNVLLCDDTCKLVDIENTLMGLPSLYRHHLVELKKLRVSEIHTSAEIRTFSSRGFSCSLWNQHGFFLFIAKSSMNGPRNCI